MTQYRFLERQSGSGEWRPEGVAYMQEARCLFYYRGMTMPQPVPVSELDAAHFPIEQEATFRWSPDILSWDQSESFDPNKVLRAALETPEQRWEGHIPVAVEELPPDHREFLIALSQGLDQFQRQQEARYRRSINWFKRHFVESYRQDQPLYLELVEILWRHWTDVETQRPPFPREEFNVALLLHARAFGLPVEDYPEQMAYLETHNHLYAPLAPPPRKWGARASLSKDIKAMLDSPVVHVWQLGTEDNIERIIIVGKGLPEHREKIFSDAFVTAMRVRASSSDLFNDGLIDIQQNATQGTALEIELPVLGADAPLAASKTAQGAMGGLIAQLSALGEDTGFVQIHKVNAQDATVLETAFFKNLAAEAATDGPILWAPDSDFIDSDHELVAMPPIYCFRQTGVLQRTRISPLRLMLPPQLLGTRAWTRLFDAYLERLVRQIEVDARIRLDFYKRRVIGLSEEKDQWDKADEDMRERRWGPTATLNQRFEEEIGLAIWLQPPNIMPIKKYFEENVPDLIRMHEDWADRMQGILNGIEEATRRRDAPFRRLITARLFDAALRERDITLGSPRIRRLYDRWAVPMAELLRFLWHKKLRSLKAGPKDLITPHTTFRLVHTTNNERTSMDVAITGLLMIPYTFLDAKRAVVLLDPKRGIMVPRDASDYPQELPSVPQEDDLLNQLLEQGNQRDGNELADLLREKLIQNPLAVSQQIIEMLGPQVTRTILSRDSEQIRGHQQEGLMNATFPRQVDLAEYAMITRALLTARDGLENARAALPSLLGRWEKTRENIPLDRREHLSPLPTKDELECRLHLLIAIAECLATDHMVKDHLPAIYRAPQAGGRTEIKEALAAADLADPDYTSEWIDYLAQWDLAIAYSRLIRGLPGEQDLTSIDQHSAIWLFDAIELVRIAANLQEATAKLSHVHETRATALVKLGPVFEQAILSNAANVVSSELINLLEILIGRQVGFDRERY